jgi:hypothetical protein
MLRFPYRQVFGDPRNTESKKFYDLDRFTVTTSIATMQTKLAAKLDELPVEGS